ALLRFLEEEAEAVLERDPKALERVIAASIRMKAGVVSKDERESGLRMIQLRPYGGACARGRDPLQGDAPRRGGSLGHGRCPGSGLAARNHFRRPDGPPGE